MIKELILFALVSLSVSAETVPPGPAYVIKPVESAFKWITKDNPDFFDFDGQPKLPTKCVKEPKNVSNGNLHTNMFCYAAQSEMQCKCK